MTTKIIGSGGFPHSEIVGSKVAHTSPTLIAACHVLHRLYMPRHPRIALTSRLRVHTTNDNTGSVRRPTRNSAEQCCRVCSVWMIISACCRAPDRSGQTRSKRPVPASVTARKLKPTPSRHRFKNPFTMSKSSRGPASQYRSKERISVLHHLDILVSVLRSRAPSVAAEPRLVALLRSAGRPCSGAN